MNLILVNQIRALQKKLVFEDYLTRLLTERIILLLSRNLSKKYQPKKNAREEEESK